MEASKRMVCGMVVMALLLVGSAQASCTVKNNSGKDILLLPVVDAKVKIYVKVGAVVEVAPIYLHVIVKNLATGHISAPLQLVDGSIVVLVDGLVKGTVDLCLGGLLNGVISVLTGDIIIQGL